MDRELEIINGLAELTGIVAGLQGQIKDLVEACYLLKARIEDLEGKNNLVGKAG